MIEKQRKMKKTLRGWDEKPPEPYESRLKKKLVSTRKLREGGRESCKSGTKQLGGS